MKTIKLKFSGMGGDFNPQDNFIINVLRKRYVVVLTENPDYLIYSVNSTDYLGYNCVRIFFTAENLVPDFNICDYGIGFSYLDFEDRYIRYPLYLVDDFNPYEGEDYARDLNLASHKHENAREIARKKTEFCSFVYSNSQAVACREKIFDALSQYKTVISGGRYKNNVGEMTVNKLDFQSRCKFVIAFENTSTSGYTTEKIIGAFAAGAIPIYWGNPRIATEFNKESFINCHDYGLTEEGELDSIERIVARVKQIDQNESLYLEMLGKPAFVKNENIEDRRKQFEEFLYHIFDQSVEDSYRRNRCYWGRRYERKQRIGNYFYQILRKGIGVRDSFRRIKACYDSMKRRS